MNSRIPRQQSTQEPKIYDIQILLLAKGLKATPLSVTFLQKSHSPSSSDDSSSVKPGTGNRKIAAIPVSWYSSENTHQKRRARITIIASTGIVITITNITIIFQSDSRQYPGDAYQSGMVPWVVKMAVRSRRHEVPLNNR